MLLWLIFLPLLGGLIGWLSEAYLRRSFTRVDQCIFNPNSSFNLFNKLKSELCSSCASWIALLTVLSSLIIVSWFSINALISFYQEQEWTEIVDVDWIPLFGIRFHLILDGFSLLMIFLTVIITIIAILYSRKESPKSSGLFYFCLLFMTSAVMMLFVAVDLFLFFFLWEAIAIPFYFLITLWGRRDSNAQLRFNGASKFVIYTQVSSLLMLISIVSLALINWKLTNEWTFDSLTLIKTPISSYLEFLLMLGFLIAFIVRIPLVPFHKWFIDAHIESSTTGSIMISGLLVNTAIYSLLRFVIPLFPNASLMIMPVMLCLALLTLFYVTLLSFNQNDIKQLIAYAHIALMSISTAVIYSGSLLAYEGLVLQIISVSLVIVGFFIISGLLVERYFTRNINQFIGLKTHVKYLSTLTLFFILAILGIPGTANFVGNFMMLLGCYEALPYLSILLTGGLILLSISIIIRFQPIFYGTVEGEPTLDKKAISIKELLSLAFILAFLFFIGLYPQWVLDISNPSINKIQQIIGNVQLALIKGEV